MTYDARELARVRNPVLLISAVTWILLLVGPGSMVMLAHHPAASAGAMPLPASFHMLLGMNPPASLAAGWALMLVAMMSPVLIPPLHHIRLRSFRHRRARSIVLFVAGYAAIWMALGGVLLAIEVAVKFYAPQSYVPAAGVFLIALVLAVFPRQTALSQSLPRSYRTGRLRRSGGFRRASFRHDTRDLVRRILLRLDVVSNSAAPGTRRRDGWRGHPDFQRTAGTANAAALALARPRQSDTHRGCTNEDTPARPPIWSCADLLYQISCRHVTCHSRLRAPKRLVTLNWCSHDGKPVAAQPLGVTWK